MPITRPPVTITSAWADAVTNQLNVSPISINGGSNVPSAAGGNKIQSGSFNASFSAANSVSGTLTFPVAFSTAPIVVATMIVAANLDVLHNWTAAPSTTAVGWRLFQKAGTNITATVTVHWIAIGT